MFVLHVRGKEDKLKGRRICVTAPDLGCKNSKQSHCWQRYTEKCPDLASCHLEVLNINSYQTQTR